MMQSFFNGLNGMLGFSRSIDAVSQNISNMNTPGYMSTNAIFQELSGGHGSRVVGMSLQTQSGEYADAGSPTTIAIDGNGFFVLRDKDGQLFYTRAGQFRFDEDGILVDEVTGKLQVMAIDENGNLVPFNIDQLRVRPPQASTLVQMIGNLSSTEDSHEIQDVVLYDSAGNTHEIDLIFERTSPDVSANTWTVEFRDQNGEVLGSGEVRFDVDGSPAEGFSEIELTFTLGESETTVTFSFGEPGSFSGATQFSSAGSNLGASVQDGSTAAGFSSIQFDVDGVLTITYTNGEEENGPQIALATFDDLTALNSTGGSFYQARSAVEPQYGRPGDGIAGSIIGSKLELSNTELTEQFAHLLIAQQGYSANSRVMSVANQLIETLYGNTGGR